MTAKKQLELLGQIWKLVAVNKLPHLLCIFQRWLPKDLWNLVLQFKRDMELLEGSDFATQLVRSGLRWDSSDVYTFPFQILYDYIQARSVYQQRLEIWGLEDIGPLEIRQFPLLL